MALGPAVVSEPVAAVETRLTPVADARVVKADPTRNFGSSSRLAADGSPATESYLRFSVPAGTGTVTRATLRLWARDGTADGPEVRSTSTAWDEARITWANRPAPSGGVVADAGRIAGRTWVAYDVTALVGGAGPVAFHLGPDSSDGVEFTSRNGSSNRPELVVESQSGDGSTETAFGAEIDTRAEEARPDQNFGADRALRTQGGSDPDVVSYLRFQVGGLSGSVQRATLRLFVTNTTADGPAVYPTGGSWTEGGLTWRNRPGPSGPAVADAGAVGGGWLDLDVTALVAGPGPVNVLLSSDVADSLVVRSSEATAAERPQLVVRTGPVTTTTAPPSTTTSAPTTTTTLPPPTTTTTLPPPTTTTTTPPPRDPPVAEAGEPWLGLARVVTDVCEPDCVRSTYSLSIADVSAGDSGDRRSAFRYPPGGGAELRLEWSRSAVGTGCGTPEPVLMEVSMRAPGGARIGTAVWQPSIPGTCTGVVTRAIHLDTNPMDGAANDADYFGVMEIYGRLTGGGDETGADTRGAPAAAPGDGVGRYARGHLVSGGVMVGWHEEGDSPVALATSEQILGEPFGLVRTYAPNWQQPSRRVRDWLAEGKYVLWSVKPPDDAAGHDDWTPVASGAQDDMIRQQITTLQSWAAAADSTVGYIFNHEPHDDADIPGQLDDCERAGDVDFPCAGTPSEFIDIYERVRGIIDDLGADRVQLVYTATLSRAVALAPGSNVLGSGDPMTRGAGGESVIDYADLIAHDSYNWYCFRAACDWEYPDELGAWGRGVALAEVQGKQLIMAETATHPGCPDGTPSTVYQCQREDPGDLPSPTRDDWLRRIGTWLESDARARRWIVGFAYYHTLHTHDWRFLDQTGVGATGEEGWRDVFVTDSGANDGLGGHDYFAQYGFNNL